MSRSIPIPDNLTDEQAREALAHASLVADAQDRERSIVVGGYSPASMGVPRDQPDQIVTLTFRRYALRADPLAYDTRPRMRVDVSLNDCTFHRGVPPRAGWSTSKERVVDRYAFDDVSRVVAAEIRADIERDVWWELLKEVRAACFPASPEPLSPEAGIMVSMIVADRKRGEQP